MRAMDALVSTASFRASKLATTLAAAHHLGVQQLALGDAVLAAQGALQFGIQLVDGDGGEKAEAAEVHREQRDLAPSDGARGGEQRAVAAQHDHQVAALGHFVARHAGDAAGVDTRCPRRMRTRDAALVQPLDQLGHQRRRRRATFGLEMIPTVLMTGIEEKLLVPFGAENGAFHDAGLESELPHGAGSPGRKRPGGVAGSRTMPPLPTWPLPDFKLRFDQYNHLPAGL